MATVISSRAFLDNYDSLSACLFAIEAVENTGAFSGNTTLFRLIRVLEESALPKLYNYAYGVFGKLYDLSSGNYPDIFNGFPPDSSTAGDFNSDYSGQDFSVGGQNNSWGYGRVFRIILNMFNVFSSRLTDITESDQVKLDEFLLEVLDAFDAIYTLLDKLNINPCNAYASFSNSTGLYLQAAGSDGSDGSVAGIHLRWVLNGELGNYHLPKGDYNNTNDSKNAYNKPNDYIEVQRMPFTSPVAVPLDFETQRPFIDSANRQWTYYITATQGGHMFANRVRLSFADANAYNATMTAIAPGTNPFAFLKAYHGRLDISMANKTCFAITLSIRREGAGTGVLKADLYSINGTEKVRYVRQTFQTSGTPIQERLIADNIQSISLVKNQVACLQKMTFETYHDLKAVYGDSWQTIGAGFSLSLDDQTVASRLENSSVQIDNRWPQYLNGTKVRSANYLDKWSVSRADDPSIKETVSQYLSLSETDPRAVITLQEEEGSSGTSSMQISYLDVLQLLATDFHIARMLGLGHIDVTENSSSGNVFVYRIRYVTKRALSDPTPVTLEYISLPTSRSDSRLAAVPFVRPLRYGLPGMETEGGALFDSSGYALHDRARLLDIGREPFAAELANDAGLYDLIQTENFNRFTAPMPLLYGILYRTAGDVTYIKPEITADHDMGHRYFAYDTDHPEGVPETVPVPDNTESLFVHTEKHEGIHEYALYGINWFSRASHISNTQASDATVFPVSNSLNPPTDIAAHYIQPEDTLVFTTQAEQDWLSGQMSSFPGQDIAFTRITFNWVDVLEVTQVPAGEDYRSAIAKADHCQILYRSQAPMEVRGQILYTQPVPDEPAYLRLYTGGYRTVSGDTVMPVIAMTDAERFLGSVLTTSEGQFQVITIVAGISGPVVTVKKIAETQTSTAADEQGNYGSYETYKSPASGSRFTVVENLSISANWERVNQQVRLVDLGAAADPVVETVVDTEGNEYRFLIGGIYGSALIEAMDQSVGTDEGLKGYYRVTYSGDVQLAQHPQHRPPFDPDAPAANNPGILQEPFVEWYKGKLRLPAVNGSTKLLEVLRIENTSPLTLYVYDAAYEEVPVLMPGLLSATIGNVNFHPGYRVYIMPEPEPQYHFNSRTLLPQGDDLIRKTLIGLQTVDISFSGYYSNVSSPVVIMARRIEEPLQPSPPSTFGLKVRPDATGKAAFTLDTTLSGQEAAAQIPFGIQFFRTSHEDILFALYEPATVTDILSALASLTEDDYYEQRYLDLANLDLDSNGNFAVFPAVPEHYGFPVPNKAGLTGTGDTLAVRLGKYKKAIQSSLLPLTEQIPVLAFIRQGNQTENRLPVIKTVDGALLNPSNQAFNPFPMIRKYRAPEHAGRWTIRFTDYQLSGTSRYLYFYAAAEVTSLLVTGPLSEFAGPVRVLQTSRPTMPQVTAYVVQPDLNAGTLQLRIRLASLSEVENITSLRIYRGLESSSVSLANMVLLATVQPSADREISISDDFADWAVVPYGEKIAYRLVAVRTINNEFDTDEEISSPASEPLVLTLQDNRPPEAPAIFYDEPQRLLSWTSTIRNGNYYLYQQSSKGNWIRKASFQNVPIGMPMTYALPEDLQKTDQTGRVLYYRFKIDVENTAGLRNVRVNDLVI